MISLDKKKQGMDQTWMKKFKTWVILIGNEKKSLKYVTSINFFHIFKESDYVSIKQA